MINFNSEKDMEDFFFQNIEHICNELSLDMWCEGGEFKASVLRQPSLGNYGVGDILVYRHIPEDDFLEINLIELKNTKIHPSHFTQCARYYTFLKQLSDNFSGKSLVKVHLVCLKDTSSVSDIVYLAQSIDWLDVYDTHLSAVNGLCLNLVSGWHREKDFDESGVNIDALHFVHQMTSGDK